MNTFNIANMACPTMMIFSPRQIFLKVASNVNDQGVEKRVLSNDDIKEAGRIPSRVRSISARSNDPQLSMNDMELKGKPAE